jgi:hypothetical protein
MRKERSSTTVSLKCFSGFWFIFKGLGYLEKNRR